MEFTNLTRRTEIGANSYFLQAGGKNLVLDCGLHPKGEGFSSTPDYSLVPEGRLDGIVITHAHQDHIGSLPLLTRREQQARVFMTPATRRIGEIMLHNSVNVMTRQRTEAGIMEYPLFTHRGIDFSRQMWSVLNARQRYCLDGERATGAADDEVTLEFHHAGHILGSAGVMVRAEGKSLFYTGDVNFEDQTLMEGAGFPTETVDVLVMETTRGDSPQPAEFTRAAEEARFAAAIRAAFARGGSVTVPVFALGKTQEVLAMLWKMRRRGELSHVPVYIGGLSTKVTTAYDDFSTSGDRTHPELLLLHEMAPYVLTGNEAASMAPRNGCVFALSSGMMTEHTLSNAFVRKVLPDPKQSLFFVGYSDPESPAGRLRRSQHGDLIELDPDLPPVKRLCHVEEFNFSAHASRESLLAYALALRPPKIVLVHGDVPAIEWFRSELTRQLPGTEVIVPVPGRPVTL